FTQHKFFPWVASGVLPIKEMILPKVVLVGSIFIFGVTLMTNQVFHGGVWGTLHNKSVKPKLEITEGVINNNTLSFDVYRVEGADVYGSWLIGIQLFDAENNIIVDYTQDDLATLNDESISNYYIAKIEPSKHSLLIPLGAKARLHLKNDVLSGLANGTYTLKMTDISGAFWEHKIEK
ncbi:MAG: quinol oxidase, partial [Bacteroidales bacterium]|nr:quinol oxidase [Bacteroidales bacterium]